MLQLVVHLPDGQITRRALDQAELIIGRDPGCDVCLPDPKVSRRHARLTGEGERWTLEDLGSVNGYLLDGEVCHDRRPWRPGSQLVLGTCTLTLEQAGAAPSARGAAAPAAGNTGQNKRPIYRLDVSDGPLAGERFALAAGEHVAGRSSDVDILLDDPSVSRRHAAFRVTHEGLVELSDLNSSNGTFVDGERILRKTVRPGQDLRIGHVPVQLIRLDGAARTGSERRHELSAGSRDAADHVRANLRPMALGGAPGGAPAAAGAGAGLDAELALEAERAHQAVNALDGELSAEGAPGSGKAPAASGKWRTLAGARLWRLQQKLPASLRHKPGALAAAGLVAAVLLAYGVHALVADAPKEGGTEQRLTSGGGHRREDADKDRGKHAGSDEAPAADGDEAESEAAQALAAEKRGNFATSQEDRAKGEPANNPTDKARDNTAEPEEAGVVGRLLARLAPASAEERAWQDALDAALARGDKQLAEEDWEAAALSYGKALALEPIAPRALAGRRQAQVGQRAADSVKLGQAELAAQRPFEALVAVAGPMAQLTADANSATQELQPGLQRAAAALEQVAGDALEALALRHGARARSACAEDGYPACVAEASSAMAFDADGEVGPALLAGVADLVGGGAPEIPAPQKGGPPSARASLAAVTARYPVASIRQAMLRYATGDFLPAAKALHHLGSGPAKALQADVAAVALGAERGGKAEAAGDANAALAAYADALTVERRLLPQEAASVPRQELAHRTQRILLARGQEARARGDDAKALQIWQEAAALDAAYLPLKRALDGMQRDAQKLWQRAQRDPDGPLARNKAQGDAGSSKGAVVPCGRLRQVVAMTASDDPLHQQADEALSACSGKNKRKAKKAGTATKTDDEGA